MDPIQATRNWIEAVVIGQNFCPFAAKAFLDERILYRSSDSSRLDSQLQLLAETFALMESNVEVETALLLYLKGLEDFEDYLELLDLAEALLEDKGLRGTFQLASFHPEYRFAGEDPTDPSNFTNRSPWPMVHILREESLENALDHYPEPEKIPLRNIAHARHLGSEWFTHLLQKED